MRSSIRSRRRKLFRHLQLESLEPRLPLAGDVDDALSEATFLGAITTSPVSVDSDISPDTDVDMYRITAAAGQIVDFDIDTTMNGPGGLGSYLRLFNSLGQQLAWNNDAAAPGESALGFDAYLRYTFGSSGSYYVGVSNYTNSQYSAVTGSNDVAGGQFATGTYRLTVQAIPMDTDDQFAEAASLGSISTTATTVNSNIATDIDVDMYRFTAAAGQVIDFDIDTASNGVGGLGSYLRLFNATGQQLAYNNDANAPGENTIGFDAYLRYGFSTSGTYYLGVSNANNSLYDPLTGGNDWAGGLHTAGTYQLTVQALPVDTDDSFAEATSLGAISSTTATINSSISTDVDVDMFKFTVGSGQTVDFDIDTALNGPGGLGSFIRLFNSQGTQLASNNDGAAPGENTAGFDAYLRYTFGSSGTYYLGVSNANNIQYTPTTGNNDSAGGFYTTGSYQLNVQTVPMLVPDPDDAIAEATSLGAITTTAKTINAGITPDVDVDMYRFTVTAGQMVDFDIDTALNGPGGLGSFLKLFDSTGNLLAYNNDSAAPGEAWIGFDAYLRYQFPTSGTFYLAVSNANNVNYSPVTGSGDAAGGLNATGDYSLTVQALPTDPDDTMLEAVSLGAASTTASTINSTISTDVDVDMYRFTAVVGQMIDIDIDTVLNGPGGLGSYLRLFNALGQQLAYNNDANAPGENTIGFDAYLRYTIPATGSYYVGVSNLNNNTYNPLTGADDWSGGMNTAGAYSITLQSLPLDSDDAMPEAMLLGAVTTTATTIDSDIVTDIDVDMYRFTVSSGQVVDFDIDTTLNGPGGLGSYLRLFNALGQEVDANNDAAAPGEGVVGFDAYMRHTFAAGGTYYLGVSNANNTLYDAVTGGYDAAGGFHSIGTYRVIVQSATIVPLDHDDTLAETTSLGPITTTPTSISSAIDPDTDVDMYRFEITAGQTIDFDIDTVQNGPGGLGSYIRLFNSAGDEMASNNDAAAPGENISRFDAYLRYTFATGGSYYLGVSNFNNIAYNAVLGTGDTTGGLATVGNYQLNIAALPDDTDDTFVESTNLGAITTTAVNVSSNVVTDIDVDIYRFSVTAGQIVDFDIDTPQNGPNGLGSFLILFNSSGLPLASNNDAAAPGESTVGFDAYLRYTFASAGTYYVGVSNLNNTAYSPVTGNNDTSGGFYSVGNYDLRVQAIPPGSSTSMSIAAGSLSISEINGTTIGTIRRSGADLSESVVVSLSSSDTNAAAVPSQVIIPAGMTSGEFPITAVHDPSRGSVSVTITASAANFPTAQLTLLITDADLTWHNAANPYDVSNDGVLSPLDAILVINYLNHTPGGPTPVGSPPPYLDVDGDNIIAPVDALMVINMLNSMSVSAEAESATSPLTPSLTSSAASASASSDSASSRLAMTDLAAMTGGATTRLASHLEKAALRSDSAVNALAVVNTSPTANLLPSAANQYADELAKTLAAARTISHESIDQYFANLAASWKMGG